MARAPSVRKTEEEITETPENLNEDTANEDFVDESSQIGTLDEDAMSLDADDVYETPPVDKAVEEVEEEKEKETEEPASEEKSKPASEEKSAETPEEEETEDSVPDSQEVEEPAKAAEPEPEKERPEASQTQQPVSPEEIQRQRAEWRASAEEQLAKSHFSISQELADELDVEPAKAIPKLMSKVYLDAVEGAVYAITSHLPQVIQSVSQSQDVSARYEGQFFEMWPQLDRGNRQHMETVGKFVQTYRAQNPQATPEEVIQNAGAASIIALKLPLGQAEEKAAPAPKPHKPVGPGAPGAPRGKSQSSNPFELLDEDVEALEDEL